MATVGTDGLSEWIIDDTCLLIVRFALHMISSVVTVVLAIIKSRTPASSTNSTFLERKFHQECINIKMKIANLDL